MQARSKAFTVVRAAVRLQTLAAKRAEARQPDVEATDTAAPLLTPGQDGAAHGDVHSPSYTDGSVGRTRALSRRVPRWKKDIVALKTILGHWLNLLLLVVPFGIAAGVFKWNATYVFVLNFLALIPLALVLGDVTEDLALRYGSIIGGLINATFGNIVEVILSIAALLNGLYGVVAASLLGSILSNLLLVTGCSFFFGGLFNKTQRFNATGIQTSGSLLFLAALGFLIPTGASLLFGNGSREGGGGDSYGSGGLSRLLLGAVAQPPLNPHEEMVLQISRGTAVLLLLSYGCYLAFQLYTHSDVFEESEEGHEEQEPVLSLTTSMGLLTLITITVAACSEYLTSSLETFSESSGLGEAFLGTIVLPIAGNACEHMTAVIVATKNKMDLSMGVAIGSSIQVALFAVPLAVVVGWITGHPFSLSFDPFSAMALMLSVAQVNFVTAGGTSHWLLGIQLIVLFVLLSLAYYFK